MKNIKKRLLSLVLAVVMVLSMSMSVFAAEVTTDKVTAHVVLDAGSYEDLGVLNQEDITLSATDFKTLFTVPSGATHNYQNKITVMDMTVQAATQWGIKDTLVINWDTYNVPNGCYMSEIFGLGTKEVSSHYSSVEGESYWTGYNWVLRVNGQKATLYGSNIQVSDGDTITWSYELTTEKW